MVRPSGKATVVDFGITKGSDERHDITTTGVLFGTPAYVALEALSGAFDHCSDLSAGVSLRGRTESGVSVGGRGRRG